MKEGDLNTQLKCLVSVLEWVSYFWSPCSSYLFLFYSSLFTLCKNVQTHPLEVFFFTTGHSDPLSQEYESQPLTYERKWEETKHTNWSVMDRFPSFSCQFSWALPLQKLVVLLSFWFMNCHESFQQNPFVSLK